MTLDHIGIAVADRAATALFESLLQTTPYKAETVEREGVRTVFFGDDGRAGAAPKLELLEALGPDSPVATFLQKRGPGLHHLAFDVDDLEREMARVRSLGIRTLSDVPKPGADGKRIVFLHPKDTAGVLVELCEAVRPAPERLAIPFRDGQLAAFASGPAGAPPLVVLHGALGSTALETDRLVRVWERRFQVVALDFMGHGESDAFESTTPTWQDFRENVEALLDALDLRDVRLFGFSMGGGVALAAALARPDRIARLAVHGVNVQWSEEEVEAMVGPMDPEAMPAKNPFWARRLAEVHGADRWRDLTRRLIAFTRGLPHAHFDDDQIAQVAAPTLVSIGDRDRFFDVRHAVGLYRALPDARLWVVPGLDHPLQGVDVSSFARVVGDHLADDHLAGETASSGR